VNNAKLIFFLLIEFPLNSIKNYHSNQFRSKNNLFITIFLVGSEIVQNKAPFYLITYLKKNFRSPVQSNQKLSSLYRKPIEELF